MSLKGRTTGPVQDGRDRQGQMSGARVCNTAYERGNDGKSEQNVD